MCPQGAWKRDTKNEGTEHEQTWIPTHYMGVRWKFNAASMYMYQEKFLRRAECWTAFWWIDVVS